MIRAVLFDFGGVIADEGFYKGLRAIAEENGLEPDAFFKTAEEIIHQIGYVIGRATEKEYWDRVREKTGIRRDDGYLREQILSRFVVRPDMLAYTDSLRASGKLVGILSDQTDWLDELDRKTPFFSHVDRVFNSYHIGKSKRDPSLFRDVCRELKIMPGEAVFVDDNPGNITRAQTEGLRAIQFDDFAFVREEIAYLVLNEA